MEHILQLPVFGTGLGPIIDSIRSWVSRLLPPVFLDGEGEDDGDDLNTGADGGGDGAAGGDQTGAGGDPGSGGDGEGEGDGEGDGSDDDPDEDDPLSGLRAEITSLKDELKTYKESASRTNTGDDDNGDTNTVSAYRAKQVEMNDGSRMTLGELFDRDPNTAYQIAPFFAREIHEAKLSEQRESEAADQRAQERLKREDEEFVTNYVKNVLADSDATNEEKEAEAVKMRTQAYAWMQKEGKFGISVSDAFILMDHAGAVSRGVSKVIKDAQRGNVRHISSKRDANATGAAGADMSKWSDEQMSKYLDGLDADKHVKFMRTASPAVRKAFPHFPWREKESA